MKQHLYCGFPQEGVDFEQRYRYRADLPYLLRVMAGMDGKFGMFTTKQAQKGEDLKVKRIIKVDIAKNRTDFAPLNTGTMERYESGISSDGTLDFKVTLEYTYLDSNYNRVPMKKDSYLVRSQLDNGFLTLGVKHDNGPGLTGSQSIADTIVVELERNSGGT
ncbi:MAG TPA: hypothetical protein HA257_07935 [Candidatus Methanoperedenaceae archaeon]|nr:hypothetical protein [Candidatus Methanoperedenaceae archaeon]